MITEYGRYEFGYGPVILMRILTRRRKDHVR